MRKIISFILILVISLNYCLFNFPLEIFAQHKDINISNKQEIKVEENKEDKKEEKLQVKLNENLVKLERGKEHKLDYEIISDGNKEDLEEEIIFSSSNENKATIKDGVIKAIDAGKVFINISTKDNKVIQTCEVHVIGESNKIKSTSSETMYEIVLEKEKSYEIINKSEEEVYLNVENNDHIYDKIEYSEIDSIVTYVYKYDFGNLYIDGNNRVKLGINSEDIKFFVPMNQKDNIEIVETQGPILYEGVLEKGKSYEIVNNVSYSITMYAISQGNSLAYYDVVIYNDDGSISSFTKNKWLNMYIYGKQKLEVKDEEYRYYMASELVDKLQITEIQGPIAYEGVLEKGKSYEIVYNDSNGI